MLKLTLKSLLARKLRFALTTFAVVLGVAFVSGSFIIADSLRATFGEIADNITSGVNVEIRPITTFEGDETIRQPAVPESLVARVAAVDGVASAQGVIQGFPHVSRDNELLTTSGGPTLGFNHTPNDATSAIRILPGSRSPMGDEMLLDNYTAQRYDIAIGDTLNVRSLTEPMDFTVTGLFTFGERSFGAIITLFDTATAQRLFDKLGAFDVINVQSRSGISDQELADAINLVLPGEYEAVIGEVVTQEYNDTFGQIINIFQYALLAFAGVALVVSAFIINNTFSIVLGQRIRELGLLRCLGATGRQVRTSVLGESVLVGIIASLAGVLAGIGVAALITWVISRGGDGAGLPAGPIILGLRTWIVSIIVGVGITLLAALAPARRAASIPPIAAISDDFTLSVVSSRRRSIVGVVIGVAGAAFVLLGVFGSGGISSRLLTLALGALLLFLAVSLLSPLVARPVARLLGMPIARLARVSGHLARENAARNPRRTSSTASALMVGLALVSMVLVVGQSFKASFTSVLDTSLKADYFIQLDTPGGQEAGISPQLAYELSELDGISLAVGFRGGPGVASARVRGALQDITGTPEQALGIMVDPGLLEGTFTGLDNNGLLVHRDPANDLDLSPGDVLTVEFPQTTRDLTVIGIFDDASITGNWLIGLTTYEQVFTPSDQYDIFVAAKIATGTTVEEQRPFVDAVAANYPEVLLQNREEFQAEIENQINQLLVTVNALLMFAIVIATLGVVNTLVLSVFERTREIGLLRAVGMTRRQTRRMIRWEAVIVTVFGGLLGVVLGVVLGFIALAALPDSFVSTVDIPITDLVLIVLFCILMGVIAAILPARRAARLNVLDAISHI